MSCTAEKSLAIKDCVFAAKSYRVSRRKRHRNKNRSSKLKKKGFKKFYRTRKTDWYKSDTYKFNSVSEKIMSNWYWSNYKKAVEWQDRHKLAHWKACALALLEENRYLLQIINNLQPGMVPKVSVTDQSLGKETNCSRKVMKMKKPKTFTNSSTFANYNSVNVDVRDDDDDDKDDGDDDNDDADDADDADEEEMSEEIEFEMSEEMIQFFEQSYKHKMNLKKIKEEELLKKAEQEVEQIQNNKIKRSVEMSFLYGDGASMITGMETAVQLSFDKYCDTKSPKYWPNIPFRL